LINDIYVIRTSKGHFLSYISTITKNNLNHSEVVIANGSLNIIFKIIKAFIKHRKIPKRIHFLDGESSILASLLFKFFFKVSVSSIYYYIQHKPKTNQISMSNFKHDIAKQLLKIGNLFGVIQFSLEEPMPVMKKYFVGTLSDYTNIKFKPIVRKSLENFNILLPGYIDERKMACEIIKILDEIANEKKIILKLTLLGSICSDYKKKIETSVSSTKHLIVEIKDEYYSDQLLSEEFDKNNAVLACYRDHYGSSGITINSIASGNPVVFFCKGVLSGFANLLPGAIYPEDISTLKVALLNLIENPSNYNLEDNARKKFIMTRSDVNFHKQYWLHCSPSKTSNQTFNKNL
jgi:hypothetical protein